VEHLMPEFDSLAALVDARAAVRPDARALVFEDGDLTYGELADLGRRAAFLFRAHDVRRGDRVGIMVGNALDLPVALFGAAQAGAILVPFHLQHRGEVLRYIADLTEPSLVIFDPSAVDEDQRSTVGAAAPDARRLEAEFGNSSFLAAVRECPPGGGDARADLPLSIMFTSGTTGRSKGVVLDQQFYLTEGEAYCRVSDALPEDVFGTVLPLSHANAQIASLVGALLAGCPLVCWRRFSASRFWSEMAERGVTVTNLLGAMTPILLKTYGEPVHEHTVRLTVGGAIPPAAAAEFRSRFGVDTREVFGLTEVGIACGETSGVRRLGSAGKPLPAWEFRIDSDGGPGEIQIRGRRPGAMFGGYWRDPERTSAAFTADGWFRTGDLGRFDEDGFLYFAGRLKDSIRRRGENISADEIELIVAQHPGVAECAALAVPSELAEDEVKLVFVGTPGRAPSAEQLHAFCTERMASFMVPRYIEARPSLPRTSTHKVIKSELTSTAPPVVDMAAGTDRS
jgi:crotonobetaine/carnitine-CoA ligase